jgi:arylsulfatase
MVELGIIDRKWPISPRDPDAPPWSDIREKEWEDRRMAVYAAQIYSMDRGIGRIMDKLRSLGLENNTLVLFLADNGGCAEFMAEDGYVAKHQVWPMRNGEYPRVGNHREMLAGGEESYMSYDLPWANFSNTPFRLFKHWVHEGGIATPFIVHWPEVVSRRRMIHEPVYITDIMATCVEVASASYPEVYNDMEIHPLEGESLAPAIRGQSWSRQQPICLEHEGNCAIRQGDWKMVKKFDRDWELYNMEKDRTELDNLIDRNKPKAKELEKLYNEWFRRIGVVPWGRLRQYYPAGVK